VAEDEVEEIERPSIQNEPPRRVRILRRDGNRVVVVEEEDTAQEAQRLKSAMASFSADIEVS